MVKLTYADDTSPGITRKRAGRRWAYYDAKGKRITDAEERLRLNAVALPPAYSDAWFCPDPNGHILATGVDARGRKQYRYHPDFRLKKEGEKFDLCCTFGKALPAIRKRVEQELKGRKLTRERAVAGVVRLLDLGAIRVGNEAYAKDNKSFGATTLRQRHAELSGKTIKLHYEGKGGLAREEAFSDAPLARMVRRMQDLPGQHLFQYIDEEGARHAVNSTEVNAFLHETMGEEFTAKHFRTWHASVLAFAHLAGADGQVSIKELLGVVSEKLGNTPAVTRKSYIHPAVIELVERQQKWREKLELPRATRWLSREERGLLALLDGCADARELLAA